MVRNLLTTVKKCLTWIVAGSTSVIIAACYGVMRPLGEIDREYFIHVKDRNARSLKGIEVRVSDNGGEHGGLYIMTTDAAGNCSFPHVTGELDTDTLTDTTFTAEARDVDGIVNGGPYRQTLVRFGLKDSIEITMDDSTDIPAAE
jgi:hypothetical protein